MKAYGWDDTYGYHNTLIVCKGSELASTVSMLLESGVRWLTKDELSILEEIEGDTLNCWGYTEGIIVTDYRDAGRRMTLWNAAKVSWMLAVTDVTPESI